MDCGALQRLDGEVPLTLEELRVQTDDQCGRNKTVLYPAYSEKAMLMAETSDRFYTLGVELAGAVVEGNDRLWRMGLGKALLADGRALPPA